MVVTEKWAIYDIDAKASPLNPRVLMPVNSSKLRSLDVACLSQSRGKSSNCTTIMVTKLFRLSLWLKIQVSMPQVDDLSEVLKPPAMTCFVAEPG